LRFLISTDLTSNHPEIAWSIWVICVYRSDLGPRVSQNLSYSADAVLTRHGFVEPFYVSLPPFLQLPVSVRYFSAELCTLHLPADALLASDILIGIWLPYPFSMP